MAKYKYVFSANAQKEFKKLDLTTKKRIAKKLSFYLEQKDPLVHVRPLVDSKIGSYRFRVGHYRIVFDFEDYNLNIVSVKHRKDVYR